MGYKRKLVLHRKTLITYWSASSHTRRKKILFTYLVFFCRNLSYFFLYCVTVSVKQNGGSSVASRLQWLWLKTQSLSLLRPPVSQAKRWLHYGSAPWWLRLKTQSLSLLRPPVGQAKRWLELKTQSWRPFIWLIISVSAVLLPNWFVCSCILNCGTIWLKYCILYQECVGLTRSTQNLFIQNLFS